MSVSRYTQWYNKSLESNRKKKREAMRRLREANPEKYNAHSRNAKKRLKDKVFEKYGRQCVGCGFEDIRALTLDHKLNNGAEERRMYGERGVYTRSLEPENTDEYQILCMNCQFIKRVEAKRQNQH